VTPPLRKVYLKFKYEGVAVKAFFISTAATGFSFLTLMDTVNMAFQSPDRGEGGFALLGRVKTYGIQTLWYDAVVTFVGNHPVSSCFSVFFV
jgi:hypothetical protein